MPCCLLPRSLSGQGLAYLHCSDEADVMFRFSAIAAKWPDLRGLLDADPQDLAAARISKRCDPYRIAVPAKWSSGAWAKVRFGLSKGTPKKTLEVIAHHLNEERIDWLFFTDGSGARIRGARLMACPIHSAA